MDLFHLRPVSTTLRPADPLIAELSSETVSGSKTTPDQLAEILGLMR